MSVLEEPLPDACALERAVDAHCEHLDVILNWNIGIPWLSDTLSANSITSGAPMDSGMVAGGVLFLRFKWETILN